MSLTTETLDGSPTAPASGDPGISVVDLFAGAGGFSAGFHAYRPDGPASSPFRTLAAVEMDPAAAATYAANFPSAKVSAIRIEGWDPTPYEGVDVIMGGPPCQGFSGLNRDDLKKKPPKSEDPRNKLWREYVRAVQVIKPKIFVIENVDRFLRSPEYAALCAATEADGPLADYHLTEKVLNAADYGVPQARRRAIVIATRRDLGEPLRHPIPSHRRATDQLTFEEGRAPWLGVWDAVFEHTLRVRLKEDLPLRTGAPLGTDLPGAFSGKELHIRRNPTPLSLARYAAIPPGGNRYDLTDRTSVINGVPVYLSTESWDNHTSGSGDVMGRLHKDRPSVTIRTEFYKPEKGRYLHPTKDRPITHWEAALIQGFPDTFKWYGSKVQIARQIGNAVPIGLGRALAEVIHRKLTAG
ncbi:DNA cytosine methyltransferase [Streptomyces sp. Tu6071]|uniref:DNA cytosine methyltransferase n=1 Tax=Streptomyces sp. Tu6071 TaxID=355249 RepID=UPI001F38011A|nr:DNA cytosine methyltransferase [Streptomyces sp. Tu6071]